MPLPEGLPIKIVPPGMEPIRKKEKTWKDYIVPILAALSVMGLGGAGAYYLTRKLMSGRGKPSVEPDTRTIDEKLAELSERTRSERLRRIKESIRRRRQRSMKIPQRPVPDQPSPQPQPQPVPQSRPNDLIIA